MRVMLFLKLMILSLCISLLSFALVEITVINALKIMALGTVFSIGITVFYPDIRGVRSGDTVAVVSNSAIPGLMGRIGRAMAHGRKNEQIKITLENGNEVLGIIESYNGLLSPAKIRIIYEDRLVD